jgi:hypothetical protein
MHNYADSNSEEFPSMNHQRMVLDRGQRDPNGWRMGGLVMVLPFIEQTAIWADISADFTQNQWHTAPYRHWIPSFLCPSEPRITNEGHISTGSVTAAPTSYRLNRGDRPVRDDQMGRGVFDRNDQNPMRITTIRDGTSNTMMLAEGVLGSVDNWNRVVGGVVGQQSYEDPPIDWRGLREADGTLIGAVNTSGLTNERLGSRWGDGRNAFVAVFTILPPNDLAITDGDNRDQRVIATASSYHPGGVSTVACDASFRFVSNNVNTGRLELVTGARHTGPSHYGIWGAYGTVAGEESVGLP